MKIGMNLLLWTTQVTPANYPLLRKLKETGFDGVEVPIFDGAVEEYNELGGELRNLGLGATAITVMDASANPISPDKAVRQAAVDRLKWVIDRAAACGAELICGPLHSALGAFSGTARTEDEYRWSIETFHAVAPYAADAKVELAVEYLNRFENYFLTTAADLAAWGDMVDRPACGLMWDTFHAHIEEKDMGASLEAVSKRLIHIHISENDRGTPGTGLVDWKTTFDTLNKIGYDRWLVIEAFGRALPELAAATRVWRDLFPDADELCRDGLKFIRSQWKS